MVRSEGKEHDIKVKVQNKEKIRSRVLEEERKKTKEERGKTDPVENKNKYVRKEKGTNRRGRKGLSAEY